MKKYVFKPYSKTFPELFKREKERVSSFIKEDLIIKHIGSTAVPNLGGKGIIDIAIAVNREKVDLISEQLKKIGYEFRPTASTPDRLFFRINLLDPEEGIRRYHIHLTYLNSKDWGEMISFRDYLRTHSEEARKYAAVKRKAASRVNEDGAKYRRMKEPTFKDIVTKILEEHRLP